MRVSAQSEIATEETRQVVHFVDHLSILELSYIGQIIWTGHVYQFVQDPLDRFVIHSTILHFTLPTLEPYLEQVFVETVAHCACER